VSAVKAHNDLASTIAAFRQGETARERHPPIELPKAVGEGKKGKPRNTFRNRRTRPLDLE
jgi:hypothetical protein